MNDCLFCKIISGEIPSDNVFEDDLIYVYINGDETTRKFAETAATLRCARDLGISRKHISVVTARLT